jgi:hypothetical protein
MKNTCMRFLLIALLTPLGLSSAGEDPWERKALSEWNIKDCDRILETSPWVRRDASLLPQLLLRGQPSGAIVPPAMSAGEEVGGTRSSSFERNPGPPNFVYFRWQSSLVLRQAMVRKLQLGPGISDEKARLLLESAAMEKALVISISAVDPQPLFRLVRGNEHSIQEQSYLLKKNKTKVPVQRIVAMDPAKGAMDLLLVFPREIHGAPTLSLEDQEVDFVFAIGEIKSRQRFRLDKMVVAGRMDI